MSKIALFPGSFDPFTIGHESIVMRGIPLFDKIIIGIGTHSSKKQFLSYDTRKKLINQCFKDYPNIEVQFFEGLTIEFCKQKNINFILRGLRTSSDFEYERAIAQFNKSLHQNIETVFLLTLPDHTFISSTIVREVIYHNGDARKYLPTNIDYEYFFGSMKF